MDAETKVQEQSHFFVLSMVLALADVLYFPTDGRGEGIVGEEIMDWVNREHPCERNSLSSPTGSHS